MATNYIDFWIKDIQSKIDFWFNNFSAMRGIFSISPLPLAPAVDARVLNHNITSTCPSPKYPSISFEHFPEPYYGDPDDDVEKLAVVVFYNPGPSGSDQLLSARGAGTFYDNYINSESDYYTLSKNLNFCLGTINGFWLPKNDQLLML